MTDDQATDAVAPSDGYEEYREQWVQTCEVMGLRYREADAVKFARDCGWDGATP